MNERSGERKEKKINCLHLCKLVSLRDARTHAVNEASGLCVMAKLRLNGKKNENDIVRPIFD